MGRERDREGRERVLDMVAKSLKCTDSIQSPIPIVACYDSPQPLKISKCDDLTATATAGAGEEPSSTRRHSARIKLKQKEEKEVLLRRRVELLDDRPEGDGASKKRRRSSSSSSNAVVSAPEPVVVEENTTVKRCGERERERELSEIFVWVGENCVGCKKKEKKIVLLKH